MATTPSVQRADAPPCRLMIAKPGDDVSARRTNGRNHAEDQTAGERDRRREAEDR